VAAQGLTIDWAQLRRKSNALRIGKLGEFDGTA
jgi:hypothetical protein